MGTVPLIENDHSIILEQIVLERVNGKQDIE